MVKKNKKRRKKCDKKVVALEHHDLCKKQVYTSSLRLSSSISQKTSKSKEQNLDATSTSPLNSWLLNPYPKPFIRDIYYAYLINGARRTKKEGYPIIEGYMVSDIPPKKITQWDQKSQVKDKGIIGMSFYSQDKYLLGILNQPVKYIEELKNYQVVLGMDASPFDNMPAVVQKSQIFINLSLTYFYGSVGLKVIPNVRVGTEVTYNSLEAYPKNHLISIGTNGFIREKKNIDIFIEQIKIVVDTLRPTGIIVYGYDYLKRQKIDLFSYPRSKGIPIYQYDSCMMKRNVLLNAIKNKKG